MAQYVKTKLQRSFSNTAATLPHTLLPADEGLSLTDFMNEVRVRMCVCVMDLCHNSGVEQMGSLQEVFPAHIRGD